MGSRSFRGRERFFIRKDGEEIITSLSGELGIIIPLSGRVGGELLKINELTNCELTD